MHSLEQARLYAILDLAYVDRAQVEPACESLLQGGADLLQLRGKRFGISELTEIAGRVHRLTSSAGVPLVINDHPEIARDLPLEGLHLGQDDLPISEARDMVRRNCYIGKSTHSIEQAIAAEAEGADYIGFGPLFATPTKPDYSPIGVGEIRCVHEQVRVPIFCIGGIKPTNLPEVLAAGATRVVIVSGLLQSRDIAGAARSAKELLLAAGENHNAKIEN